MKSEELIRAAGIETLGTLKATATLASAWDELVAHLMTEAAPPVWQLGFPAAEAHGGTRGESGAGVAEVSLELLRLVRVAEEALSARGAHTELLARFRALGDEAVGRAVAGWDAQRKDRREDWLSFLVHDLKNPLNTILNALWLLRGRLAGGADIEKLLRMVERAAHRIESTLVDVRALESKSVSAAPKSRPMPKVG